MENRENLQDKTKEFLDKYSTLENLIERNFRVGSQSPVKYLSQTKEYAYCCEQLDYCREVRNLLSHNPRLSGQYLVSPSDAMLDFLDSIIAQLDSPTRAADICTKMQQLIICRSFDFVLPLVEKMYQKRLSHTPLVQDGKIIGVFSRSALFSYIACGGVIDQNTRLSALVDFLWFGDNENRYAFADINASVYEVRSLFVKSHDTGGKLSVVFLTEGGTKGGNLFGLITPFDFFKNPQRKKDTQKKKRYR